MKDVKDDLLIVSCVKLAEAAYKDAGIPMPSVQELVKMTTGDKPTWDIYAKGLTVGVNQVEQPKSTSKAMRYKPQNVAEMSALVAAIRPGFKSMIDKFLSREKYSYGIPAIDNLLRSKEIPDASWLLYQEQIMSIARFAGISPSDGYRLIKAISKKKLKVIEGMKAQLMDGLRTKGIDEAASATIWGVIESSASYSFNASHSYCVACDSLYAAYLKAHYPLNFFHAYVEIYTEKGDKDKIAAAKIEALKGFGIRFVPPRFRQDNRTFQVDKEQNAIVDVLSSAKGMSKTAAEELYEFKDVQSDYFCDLIYNIWQDTSLNKSMIDILIKANYFIEYGGNAKLYRIWNEIKGGKYRWDKSLKSFEDRKKVVRKFEKSLKDEVFPTWFQVQFEILTYGNPQTIYPNLTKTIYAITDVEVKKGVSVLMFNMRTGTSGKARIAKTLFGEKTLKVGDCITVTDHVKQQAYSYENGHRTPLKGVVEVWLKDYEIVKDTNLCYTAGIANEEEILREIKREEKKNEQLSFLY